MKNSTELTPTILHKLVSRFIKVLEHIKDMHTDILFKTIYGSNRIQIWIYQFGKFDNIKKCIYISFFSGRRQTILGNFKEEKFLEPILVDKN